MTMHENAAPAELLHPLSFPLRGSSLIEASAGTGKTFTIAMLYVRLVLGHGGTAPLTPPEILVVTFTDAATKELRDRIRARLNDAAAYFRVGSNEDEDEDRQPDYDPLLDELRDAYDPAEWAGCARRLQLAAEWMDEAAVSTIHGWCNRMLSEHAFDSDSLFSQTLETDQSELRAEVVRDYWRTFFAPLDETSAREVRQWFRNPDDLQKGIGGLIGHAALLPEADEPQKTLAQVREQQRDHLDGLKQDWPRWADELQAQIDEAREKKQFKAMSLNRTNCKNWIDKLRDWSLDADMTRPDLKPDAKVWERLTHAGLAEIWTLGTPLTHPALDAVEQLPAALAARPEARDALLCHAARWVERRFAEEEARRSQMGFDDLLTRLAAALGSANGERLAELIRKQYPVALIDEFQDTDPIQYAIFERVYRIGENDPATAIVLIGDPKQAIYAFRGADIFTYLAARRACAGRLYTLKKNFRSSEAMVAAVNRCFEAAETRLEGAGAFLFRRGDGTDNPLPFVPADAKGRSESLQAEGRALPALTAWWLPASADGKPLSRDAYLRGMAEACATEMVRLLNLGEAGAAGFASEQGFTPLAPADMAVLVNNRNEARAIREALAARGVRSVYLSDKDSVYQTAEADELRYWLAACAEPDDGRLVRAALATSVLGLDWAELDALGHDELAWEARVLQFREYRECWRTRGVLPMLRRLLNDFHVPQRFLGATTVALNGERTLTNLLHLAELLQQASTQLDGEHALIRYLDEQRQDEAQSTGDARQLRLESDAGLVQVVTVHKSKGLEYPLVFLPFACAFRQVKATDLPLKWHDDAGRLQISLGEAGSPGALAQADRERLGEDLRKLYVALTRACHATWVGVAPIQGVESSAFGYLLAGGRAIAAPELGALLDEMRGASTDIDVAEAPVPLDTPFVMRGPVRVRGAARALTREVREHWWIASYSSLRRDHGMIGGMPPHAAQDADDDMGRAAADWPEAPDTRGEDVFQELLGAGLADEDTLAPTSAPLSQPADASLHGFARGAEAGSFLHELMEWAANEGFDALSRDPSLARDTVARRCNVRGWARWIEPLTAWLNGLVDEPLRLPAVEGDTPAPLVLANLTRLQYMAEMEFWVSAHTVDTHALDELVSTFTLDGALRPALETTELNGMLKGFIDLVFEHEGRYYVADYKSNWLGPDDAAYTNAKMRAQILHSRYELQYVLYLFALHRLLKTRLPDYDYDRHVGGAVYMFLRGVHAPSQGLHVERVPRELIEQLDELFERHADALDNEEEAL